MQCVANILPLNIFFMLIFSIVLSSCHISLPQIAYLCFSHVNINNITKIILSASSGVDNIPPVITGCPDPINLIIPIGMTSLVVNWTEPTATDNSGIPPNVFKSHEPGEVFPVGTTQVIYVFTDTEGNEESCTFEIQIGN